MGMVVACVTLRLTIIKVRYFWHMQWNRISKSPTAWANIYGSGVLGMGKPFFHGDGKNFMETDCPTRGACFGTFIRGSKLWMGFIKKRGFGVTSEIVKNLLVVWEIEWKMEVTSRKM